MTSPSNWSYFDDRLAAPVEDIKFKHSAPRREREAERSPVQRWTLTMSQSGTLIV